jgi:hypothetical protein
MPAGAPEPERPPVETPTSPPPTPEPDEPAQAAEPAVTWQFSGSGDAGTAPGPALPDEITWTASEYIAHEKSPGWFGLLALGAVLVAAAVYFLTKDKITTGIVIFAAICLGIFSARKPNVQSYALDGQGVTVGQKRYSIQAFKSFSIAEDGAIASVVFMPLKRFMPPLTIYVAPEMEEQIIGFLSQVLPFEHHRQDMVDGLLRRIRF